MLKLSKLADRLAQSTTARECWSNYLDFFAPIGINAGMLVYIPAGDHQYSNFFTVSKDNYPRAFMKEYEAAGGLQADLSMRIMLKTLFQEPKYQINGQPCFDWALLDNAQETLPEICTPVSLKIEEISRVHKVEFGFSLLLDWRSSIINEQSLFCVGCGFSAVGMTEQQFSKKVRPHTQLIAQSSSLLSKALKGFKNLGMAEFFDSNQVFTQHELTLISLMANDKTPEQIGELLKTSLSKIENDIGKIQNKMHLNQPCEVVALAQQLNIIKAGN